MRILLIIGFVFVGLQNFMFAGKDEKIAEKIDKSSRKNIKNHDVTKLFPAMFSSSSSSSSSSSVMSIATDTTLPFKKAASGYYNPQRKSKLYDASSLEQFTLSRSKLEAFLACPVCFYLDRKKGLTPPPGFPFSLNNAVDALQKKEFDIHRTAKTVHPLCTENDINAIPFEHAHMDKWRNSLSAGLKSNIAGTNITLQGGVDDIWEDQETKELIIVDYKATSKKGEVSLDADWQDGYKRQVEVYQELLRDNGHKVSDTAYFVYSNGRTDVEKFNNELQFKTTLIPYQGNSSWVKQAVVAAYQCLQSDTIPSDPRSKEISEKYCDLCRYTKLRNSLEKTE